MPLVTRRAAVALALPLPFETVAVGHLAPVDAMGAPRPTADQPIGTILVDADGRCWSVEAAPAEQPTATGTVCEPANLAARDVPRVRLLVALRDAARALVNAERATADDTALPRLRATLNAAYDAVVDRYGPLNAKPTGARAGGTLPTLAGFLDDPDAPLVAALEAVDEEADTYDKAPIFTQRIVSPLGATVAIDQPEDALAVVLNRLGHVDIDAIAGLLNATAADAADLLTGRIFKNPATSQWEQADEYLSGDIIAKLARAEALAARVPRYQHHVTALRCVLPVAIAAKDIDIRLGAPWLPLDVVRQFIQEVLRPAEAFTVDYTPEVALWVVTAKPSDKHGFLAAQRWGTERRDAFALIDDALNGRLPTLTTERRVDAILTQAARHKLASLQAEFRRWVWLDTVRTATLTARYNDRFNRIVPREYRGDHLTLPGTNTTFTFRPHQKDTAWRGVVGGNLLLAHEVGTGKSAIFQSIIMEWRRLGKAQRPMLAVPNGLLAQTARDFATLYPTARLLVVWNDEGRDAVERTLARALTGAWDCIIVGHSVLARLSLSDTGRRDQLAARRDASQAILDTAADDDWRLRRATTSQLEALDTMLLRGGTTASALTIHFDALGVDALVVDEAHEFKGLAIGANRDGQSGGAAKAEMLALQIGYLQARTPGRNVILASGTVISNHMADLFVFMWLLQRPTLEAAGVDTYAGWIGQFGVRESKFELSADGQYRFSERLRAFRNVPELRTMLAEVADFKWMADLKLPVPRLDGDAVRVVVTKPSAAKRAWMTNMIDDTRGRRGGLLEVVGLSRRATLSFRLVNPDAPIEDGKLTAVANSAYAVWRDTTAERGTQLIFIDTSTPASGAGDHAYLWLRQLLVERGIPISEIAFVHDAKDQRARHRLFSALRNGVVRICIGSTPLLGQGVNVQHRLRQVIEVDAPWRCGDVSQRHGRIVRPGNMWPSVRIERHVEAGSFDAFLYQTLERKAHAEYAALRGDTTIRTLDLGDDAEMSFSMAKAIATGDPRILEKAQLETRMLELTRAEREWAAERRDAAFRQSQLPQRRAILTIAAEQVSGVQAARAPHAPYAIDADPDDLTASERIFARLTRPDGSAFETMADAATALYEGLHARRYTGASHGPVVLFDALPVVAREDYRTWKSHWAWGTHSVDTNLSEYSVATDVDRRAKTDARLLHPIGQLWFAADRVATTLTARIRQLEEDTVALAALCADDAVCPHIATLHATRERLATIDAELGAATNAADGVRDTPDTARPPHGVTDAVLAVPAAPAVIAPPRRRGPPAPRRHGVAIPPTVVHPLLPQPLPPFVRQALAALGA